MIARPVRSSSYGRAWLHEPMNTSFKDALESDPNIKVPLTKSDSCKSCANSYIDVHAMQAHAKAYAGELDEDYDERINSSFLMHQRLFEYLNDTISERLQRKRRRTVIYRPKVGSANSIKPCIKLVVRQCSKYHARDISL